MAYGTPNARPSMTAYGYQGKMAGRYAKGYRMALPAAAPMAEASDAGQNSAESTAEPAEAASVSIAQMRFATPIVDSSTFYHVPMPLPDEERAMKALIDR